MYVCGLESRTLTRLCVVFFLFWKTCAHATNSIVVLIQLSLLAFDNRLFPSSHSRFYKNWWRRRFFFFFNLFILSTYTYTCVSPFSFFSSFFAFRNLKTSVCCSPTPPAPQLITFFDGTAGGGDAIDAFSIAAAQTAKGQGHSG